jgi:hypothetical protein
MLRCPYFDSDAMELPLELAQLTNLTVAKGYQSRIVIYPYLQVF